MADDDSVNPGNEEEADSNASARAPGTASAAHKQAVQAEEPLEKKPDDADATPEEKALKDQFNPHKLTQNKIPGKDGRIKDENKDTITLMETQQNMTMGQMFNGFLELILALINGDWETFTLLSEDFLKTDVIDPADRVVKKTMDKTVKKAQELSKDKEFREETPKERKEILAKLFEENEFLQKSKISKLLDLIVEKESRGGEPNIVFDYRHKLKPGTHNLGKATSGLMPGDTTPGGLTVPEFTTMTVNEVLAWQKQYLDEQYSWKDSNGTPLIPRGTGSSAVGAYQFVYTTLKEMRDQGLIDGNAKFTLENQTEFAIKRAIHMRNFGDLFKNNITETDYTRIARNLRLEWEGAKHINMDTLVDTLKEIRENVLENLPQETIVQLASAKDFTIKPL